MLGKNIIMKVDHRDEGSLLVHSIFLTVQGEGPFAGHPAVFVRLGGCSLACSWCDTDFNENTSDRFTVQSLITAVEAQRAGAALCVITGGEPMRQNLLPFIARLFVAGTGWSVQIETAGIHWIKGLEDLIEQGCRLSIVCSPKTPKLHPTVLKYASCFKYIVAAGEPKNKNTGLPLLAVSQHNRPTEQHLFQPPTDSVIYVQPLDHGADQATANRVNAIYCAHVAMLHGYRLSLQQHKILGLP